MTIHCRVTAFLSADTARDLVILTFDILTFNSCHTWRVTLPTLLPSMKTLRLSVLELWVIMFPIDYHWKCIRGHCACAESRDPWVGGQKQLHIWNPQPRFAYSLFNYYWATTTIKGRLLKKTWSWNGYIRALLKNGKKIQVRPFESIEDCLAKWSTNVLMCPGSWCACHVHSLLVMHLHKCGVINVLFMCCLVCYHGHVLLCSCLHLSHCRTGYICVSGIVSWHK